MTPDQVSGFFDAGESFVEGTIAAALVRPLAASSSPSSSAGRTCSRNLRKFTLRLGADLWWIIYVGLRESAARPGLPGQLHLLLPGRGGRAGPAVTGGLAAVCAFAVLLIKLMTGRPDVARPAHPGRLPGPRRRRSTWCPYILGVQLTNVHGRHRLAAGRLLHELANTDLALPLCYLSAALVGIIGLVAVVYNLRQASVRRPRPRTSEERPHECRRLHHRPRHQRPGLAGPLAVAPSCPILWAFTLIMHFGRPYIIRFLQHPDAALRRRRVVAVATC